MQPAHVEELLKSGKTVLRAKTHEELGEMLAAIPADCKYAVGAIGRSHDGCTLTLQVEITKK